MNSNFLSKEKGLGRAQNKKRHPISRMPSKPLCSLLFFSRALLFLLLAAFLGFFLLRFGGLRCGFCCLTSIIIDKLKNSYERNVDLHKQSLISTEMFQQSKYDYESQKAAYDLAELEYKYTAIRTPISGVVAERLIKVGNMVLPNQSVFRVAGLDPLIAILHVPERQLGKLRPGLAAKLIVDASSTDPFTGRIKRISPVIDRATGTVKVTVEVRDPSRRLKPGMFARINIIYDVHENVLTAPKDAIISEDRENAVFVVRDSVAYRQVVTTGYVNTTAIEVLTGLKPGDTIVTTGKASLKDSAKVQIVKR